MTWSLNCKKVKFFILLQICIRS